MLKIKYEIKIMLKTNFCLGTEQLEGMEVTYPSVTYLAPVCWVSGEIFLERIFGSSLTIL